MAKQPRVWSGSQWEPLAVTLPDLSNYSTTTQMNTAIGVYQVVSTAKTDTFSASVALGSFATVTGLSATITPTISTNKILVTTHLHLSTTASWGVGGYRLKRNSTVVGVGDLTGSRKQQTAAASAQSQQAIDIMNISMTFLDNPSTTSATTYSVEFYNFDTAATQTLYLNRSSSDPDNNAGFRPISTITLMEVKA